MDNKALQKLFHLDPCDISPEENRLAYLVRYYEAWLTINWSVSDKLELQALEIACSNLQN